MSRCRTCRTPKWKGDPCRNAECSKNTTTTVRLKSTTLPITATTKHGYHAGTAATSLLSDYDAPIRARAWRTVS
jgi:hypothetical protein